MPPGVERTLAGRLHDAGSGLAQLALFAAAALSLRAVPWSRRLRSATTGLLVLALVLMACGWELGLVATLGRAGELAERRVR